MYHAVACEQKQLRYVSKGLIYEQRMKTAANNSSTVFLVGDVWG